jgi:hypothetical protein
MNQALSPSPQSLLNNSTNQKTASKQGRSCISKKKTNLSWYKFRMKQEFALFEWKAKGNMSSRGTSGDTTSGTRCHGKKKKGATAGSYTLTKNKTERAKGLFWLKHLWMAWECSTYFVLKFSETKTEEKGESGDTSLGNKEKWREEVLREEGLGLICYWRTSSHSGFPFHSKTPCHFLHFPTSVAAHRAKQADLGWILSYGKSAGYGTI